MSHYMYVCQYGYVHSQCRCPGEKIKRPIECHIRDHIEHPMEGSTPKTGTYWVDRALAAEARVRYLEKEVERMKNDYDLSGG